MFQRSAGRNSEAYKKEIIHSFLRRYEKSGRYFAFKLT